MKKPLIQLLYIAALIFTGITPLTAAPTVSNVRVAQRDGTNLVDVYYDLSGSSEGGATVTVELSENGGASYGLPIASLSGHVGGGVANGRYRHLVWDAGSDRPDSFSETMRLRLGAVDSPPVTGEFALIPAGSFQMGDAFSEGEGNERPVHTVNLSDFYMAKHETTKEQWDSVRVWGLNNGYTDLASGGGKGANHPVHSVTWYDIVKWCNARSQKDGLTPCYTVGEAVFKTGEDRGVSCNFAASGYRLPTEAEWEKAARGGLSGKRFPWGDTISHSQANYYAIGTSFGNQSGNAGDHPTYNDGTRPYSAPVGSFAPNGYGLYDMTGNMWEWCWDWYGASYYGLSPASDPRGASSGVYRVFRSGSWGGHAIHCRVAIRFVNPPTSRDHSVGFRTARSSVPR